MTGLPATAVSNEASHAAAHAKRAARVRAVSAWRFVRLGLVTVAAVLFATGEARACGSCRGPAGPGATLTAPWERWGVALSSTSRSVHGAWNAGKRYIALGDGSLHHALDGVFGAAFRPKDAVEVAGMVPFGYERVVAPGFASTRSSVGDLSLRVKWDVVAEPAIALPNTTKFPSLGLSLTVRAPTGVVDRAAASTASGASGTVGSTATSQGLGTWEGALAADVRKTFATHWQAALVGEGALRLPDDALGVDRRLGPRVLGRVLVLHLPESPRYAYAVGVFTDVAWESDVTYAGRRAVGTAQRLWSVGVTASMKIVPVGYRAGMSLAYQPPVSGVGANALGAVALGLFVAYGR